MSSELKLPIERWLKFTATQAGRDKIYRFIQYFSRFLAHHLRTKTPATEWATRLAKLSLAIGLGRKRRIQRLGIIYIKQFFYFFHSFSYWQAIGFFSDSSQGLFNQR